MSDEPLEGDVPIAALRDALEEAPEPVGMQHAVVRSVEHRMMCAWLLELALVVFGWVALNHLKFVRSLGGPERGEKGHNQEKEGDHGR